MYEIVSIGNVFKKSNSNSSIGIVLHCPLINITVNHAEIKEINTTDNQKYV